MKNKKIVVLVSVGAVTLVGLLLAVTGVWAGPGEGDAAAPLAPAATVSGTISYQGRLLDSGGDPVDDTRVMTFSLYHGENDTVPQWIDIFPVEVEEGLFHVSLDVDPALFDGRALWLGVWVEGDAGEMSPRQRLQAAPYALTLRPGAAISGALDFPVLRVGNAGSGPGVEGASSDSFGVAGLSENGAGVQGESVNAPGGLFYSTHGSGVVAGSGDGHALVTEGPSLIEGPNPQQIALLKWYPAIQTSMSFTVGTWPTAIAYDGAHVWVVNANDGTVSVLRASDGMQVMTPTTGLSPDALAYDGSHMWVVNGDDTVSVIRASDGAHVMTPTVGSGPAAIAFDGANMWVVNELDNTVSVLQASDGAHVMTVSVGTYPMAIAFDGANMWVANYGDDTVSVLRASDGTHVMTPTVASGAGVGAIAFDGANMWVVDGYGVAGSTVSVLRASDGVQVMTPTVVIGPTAIAFDGANMWVVNSGDDTVSVLRASDGALVELVSVGDAPVGIAFDGAHMWVVNRSDGTVSKR